MEEVAVRKENHVLRSVTAIMLFLIAFAHFNINYGYGYGYSQEYGDFIQLLVGFGRFTIPVFFMISGYYCFSKDGHSENNLGKKAIHILYLIILLKVSYLILTLIAYGLGDVSMDYVIKSFVVYEFSSTCHIWFLYALILIYVFFWALHRFKVEFRRIFWIAWIPLILTFIFAEIIPLFGTPIIANDVDYRHISDMIYPFLGITFFIFGYWLHQNKEKLDVDVSFITLVVFIVFGTISAIIETHFLPERTLYFGTLLQATGLFMITFRFAEDQLRFKHLEFIGKNLMPYFYVYMMAPIFVCGEMLRQYMDPLTFYVISPIVCVIVTLIIAALVYCLIQYLVNRKKKAVA